MVDIPGCYSLMAHSTEEEVARDFICFENPDAVIVVCDATCLERNLNLVLQILEANRRAVVCVNLMDEAKKKSITIRFDILEERLGVPVIGTAARSGKGLEQIYEGLNRVLAVSYTHLYRGEFSFVYNHCLFHGYIWYTREYVRYQTDDRRGSTSSFEGAVRVHF